MKTDRHELDVVIPTKDRPDQLVVTLEALVRQSFTDFGVIVVDDGSESAVEAVVPMELRRSLGIRFVRNQESQGAGPARNRGVEHSEAPYVIFIDDDCIAGPRLIERHHQALSTSAEPVVSLGPIISVHGRRLPVWSHWDADKLERVYSDLAAGRLAPRWNYLFTGNVGLRRADFLAVRGFDERFHRGEDVELGYRLDLYGCRFTFDAEASVEHDSQRSLHSWMRIAASAALSDIEMQQRDPESRRLEMVLEQLVSRHWALRLTRQVLGGPVAGRFAIAGALGAGIVLHVVRADRMAFAAVSVVRDLTYWRSLQEALPQLALEAA